MLARGRRSSASSSTTATSDSTDHPLDTSTDEVNCQGTEECEKEEVEVGKGRKKVSLRDESDGESEQALDR